MRKRKWKNKPFIVDIEEWKRLEFEQDKVTLEHEKLELKRLRRYERLQKIIHRRGREAIKGYIV